MGSDLKKSNALSAQAKLKHKQALTSKQAAEALNTIQHMRVLKLGTTNDVTLLVNCVMNIEVGLEKVECTLTLKPKKTGTLTT